MYKWSDNVYEEKALGVLKYLGFQQIVKKNRYVYSGLYVILNKPIYFLIYTYIAQAKKKIDLDECKIYYANLQRLIQKEDMTMVFLVQKPLSEECLEFLTEVGVIVWNIQDLILELIHKIAVQHNRVYEGFLQETTDQFRNQESLPPLIEDKMGKKFSCVEFILFLEKPQRYQYYILEAEDATRRIYFAKYMVRQFSHRFQNHQSSSLAFGIDASQMEIEQSPEEFFFHTLAIDSKQKEDPLDILEGLVEIILIVYHIEILYKKNPATYQRFMEYIFLNQELGRKIIFITEKDFLFFFHQKNHYFSSFIENTPEIKKIFYAQMKPSAPPAHLTQKLPKNKTGGLQGFHKWILQFPYFYRMLLENKPFAIEKLNRLEDLIQHFLLLWKTQYLSLTGKEVLGEEIALFLLQEEKDFHIWKNTPDYIENFIVSQQKIFQYRSLAEQISEDLQEDSLFHRHFSYVRFQEDIWIPIFIVNRLIREFQRNNYEKIFLLRDPLVMKFYLFFQKEDHLYQIIFHKMKEDIHKYHLAEYIDLLLVLRNAKELSHALTFFGQLSIDHLDISTYILRGLKLSGFTFTYSSFDAVDIRFSHLQFLKLEHTHMDLIHVYGTRWKYISMIYFTARQANAKKTFWYQVFLKQGYCPKGNFIESHWSFSQLDLLNFEESFFRDSIFESVNFFSVIVHSVDFYGSTFSLCHWQDVEGQSVLLNKTQWHKGCWLEVQLSFSSLWDMEILEGKWESCVFQFVQFHHSLFSQMSMAHVEFDQCIFDDTIFDTVVFREVDFRSSDLRRVSFKNCTFHQCNFPSEFTLDASEEARNKIYYETIAAQGIEEKNQPFIEFLS